MYDRIMNRLSTFAEWAEEKLDHPQFLTILLGFWIAIGFCGFVLTSITFFRYDPIVLSIGLLDIFLAMCFGMYYYVQKQNSRGRHQKHEKK